MTGNVIDFRKAKADRMIPECGYNVLVEQYADGVAGRIYDLGDNLEPDILRLVSEQLFTLARYIMDQAWEKGGEDRDQILNTQIIFKDGRVRTWTANAIETEEQVDWLRGMAAAGFDDIEGITPSDDRKHKEAGK